MENMKEITDFKFPKFILDQNGYGKKSVKAIIAGDEAVYRLYNSSLSEGNQSGWYEHRFILFQMFFNKGCVFKLREHNKYIDSNIFSLLDINIVNMIEHPSDSQEKQAVKTSREVVNSFIKGKEILDNSYSIALKNKKSAKQDREGDLKNRADSVIWLEEYYGVIKTMFGNGLSILIPNSDSVNTDTNKEIASVSNNILFSTKNKEVTIAEQRQKIRQESKQN